MDDRAHPQEFAGIEIIETHQPCYEGDPELDAAHTFPSGLQQEELFDGFNQDSYSPYQYKYSYYDSYQYQYQENPEYGAAGSSRRYDGFETDDDRFGDFANAADTHSHAVIQDEMHPQMDNGSDYGAWMEVPSHT